MRKTESSKPWLSSVWYSFRDLSIGSVGTFVSALAKKTEQGERGDSVLILGNPNAQDEGIIIRDCAVLRGLHNPGQIQESLDKIRGSSAHDDVVVFGVVGLWEGGGIFQGRWAMQVYKDESDRAFVPIWLPKNPEVARLMQGYLHEYLGEVNQNGARLTLHGSPSDRSRVPEELRSLERHSDALLQLQ